YESYAQQLESAQQALDTCEMMIVTEAEIESALSLPQTYIGKAVGLAVYQNHTGALIERLGDFEVSVFDISPVLSDFVRLREARKNIAPRVENMSDNRWLLFTDAQTTTVVTLFHDEPAQEQISEIVRIHQAFETIGKAMLEKRNQDPKKIASSFGAYVQRIPRRA
ncbi:MAG: hypothetical protein K8L99_24510, partial [Anaerolineae bacterium]|nr:hypothetical protein [Anaerolineae bacterium]